MADVNAQIDRDAAAPAVSSGRYAPSPLTMLLDSRRKGMLTMQMELWRRCWDLTRVELGRASYYLVVHPRHVRAVSVGGRYKYDKVRSYQTARDLLFGR